jgi:hypothetical protein
MTTRAVTRTYDTSPADLAERLEYTGSCVSPAATAALARLLLAIVRREAERDGDQDQDDTEAAA